MYVHPNFKTKKALKEAVKNGEPVTVTNPGPFDQPPNTGSATIEGPHYPEPHRWYAQVDITDGLVTGVK
jgi:hypothetical protein